METTKSGIKIVAVVANLLMVGFGIYLLFYPRGIIWIFSLAVAIHGISQIIRYFGEKEARNGWDIVAGVLNILFGALMMFGGAETRVLGVLSIEIFIAIWAVITGIARIFGSFSLKKLGGKKWFWSLLGGIGLILCGIVCFAWPLASAALFVGFIGIFTSIALIVSGLTGVADAFSTPKSDDL